MRNISECISTNELVRRAKEAYNITARNGDMGEDDIRMVVRWIGEQVLGNTHMSDKLVMSRTAIDLMLFVTVSEFPLFYMWHKLSQWN
jgi:hypothetical protein